MKELPDMYKKNLIEIDYAKLKKIGIKTLVFDFDNTIIEPGKKKIKKNIIDCLMKLKKDFHCVILSNSIKIQRLQEICKTINIEYHCLALKPLKIGFNKINKLYKLKQEETCIIGDQYFTDIIGGKKMNYYTVLIDPIGLNENIFAKVNRIREKIKYNKIKLRKGSYYD